MCGSEWKEGKNTYKSEKQPISHFKLLFQTASCGIHIFPVVFSDCTLCILLDTAGTWGLYFCLHDSQNELFFKIDIFARFYVASWWIGVPVPQRQSWASTLGNALMAAWQGSGLAFRSASSWCLLCFQHFRKVHPSGLEYTMKHLII